MRCALGRREVKSSITGGRVRRDVKKEWFTGPTVLRDVGGPAGYTDHGIYHVTFRGSRTKLHRHGGSQILIGTGGRGSLETYERLARRGRGFSMRKTGTQKLAKGDIVHIPAGVLHAHGSSGKGDFSHIALNVSGRPGAPYRTWWYESDFESLATGLIS